MTRKLTITVEDDVYQGLHSVVGRRRISRFLNDLARPHVTRRELGEAYRAMAADEEREREAAEWVDDFTDTPPLRAARQLCRPQPRRSPAPLRSAPSAQVHFSFIVHVTS